MNEHYFQPTPIIEELLSAHLTDDAIWDKTTPCDVFFNIIDDTETTTSIQTTNKSTYDCRKLDFRDPVKVITSMSHDNDEPWFDAHEDFDLWYVTSETMNNYNE